VALGKILTLDNLQNMNVIVVDRCGTCKKSEESINHLLLHCEVVKKLWSLLFPIVWGCMDYAAKGERVERDNWDTVMLWKCRGWLLCV
jgi:hypothetical protein